MSESGNQIIQLFSEEKLREFGGMSLSARLRWLEEANLFINRTLGFERRARFDERFRDFPPKSSNKGSIR
jgi:hypothetical protein